jgi:hypothetical protein
MKIDHQQKMYDALKKITKYMTPDQIRRDSDGSGLDYEEYLEMVYENIQQEAKNAIYKLRRPKG